MLFVIRIRIRLAKLLDDRALDPRHDLPRVLDARPRGEANVECELIGVHRGEQLRAGAAHAQDRQNQTQCGGRNDKVTQADQTREHALEPRSQRRLRLGRSGITRQLGRADEVGTEGRDHEHGDNIAAHHGKDHRHRQRLEQKTRDAGQEHHWKEDDDKGNRRDEHREGHLAGAVEGGLHPAFPHPHVSGDVVQHHDRLVHQDSDRQGQSAQRHAVDGIARKMKPDQGNQD